jgi:3-phosphoshikimate 1-carboxyvinyltransferase
VVRPPGSKSETNRALVCAALAPGTSVVDGVLHADDTAAMVDCLRGLGAVIRSEEQDHATVDTGRLAVEGVAGRPHPVAATLDARLSGTTARFVTPVASLGPAQVTVDGAPGLVARPMDDLIDALVELGAGVGELGAAGRLPLRVGDPPLRGGAVSLRGDVSSQFLSGLLLAAPCTPEGVEVTLTSELVSVPYVELTVSVMRRFGAEVEVEPDATAATYLMAAPLLAGGRVRVLGIGTRTRQGDAAFAEVLARMGASVEQGPDWTEVASTGGLRGIDVDLSDTSDTAQTLAVVAAVASGTTTVRGIGFIRGKETDRIAAVVTELTRLGVEAEERPDGFTVHGGRPRGGVVRTYGDHRMAMSFALLGLRVPGVVIEDPDCVDKTFPGYFGVLDRLTHGSQVVGDDRPWPDT